MDEKKDPEKPKQTYLAKCARCTVPVELAEPLKKNHGMICNNCYLKWTEIRDKMIGHAYQDEVNAAFVRFVTSPPFLKKHII